MSVRKTPEGRRSVEVQVEVPGTPEEVWRAIATGPGISSWFVRTEVDERAGGAIVFHLGPGMDSTGVVTVFEPPRRLVYEEREWNPGAPPLATECFVETRSGGTCVVRIVHSLFTASDAWDDQLESFESGWPGFFRILKLAMTHFRGQPCTSLRIFGGGAGTEAESWKQLLEALGLAGATVGERRTVAAFEPPLAGLVESVGGDRNSHELVLRLEEPAGGLALLGAHAWEGKVHLLISLYLYGDRGCAMAEQGAAGWEAWMARSFPVAASA